MPDGPTKPTQGKRIALGSAAAAALALVVLVVVLQNRADDDRPPNSSTTPTSTAQASPGSDTEPTKPAKPGSSASAYPVPSVPPVVTKSPKPIPARFEDDVVLDNGVAVEVTDIEAVKGEARGPGQVAGPALRFTITVSNQSKKTIDLDLAIVTAYSGRRDDPAIDLAGPGASPLPAKLKAGATASGKYVFAIPKKQRGRVRVDFSYTIDQSRVIFRGPGS